MTKKTTYFSWENRPDYLKKYINSVFKAVSKNKIFDKGWTFNGDSKYNMCGVDDHKLISNMVKNSPNQNKFTVLDLGAGKFQWTAGMAKYFAQNHPTKQLVAIGLSGEKCDDEAITIGNSKIIPLCGFKTEEIIPEFKKLGYHLENSIDLIVSRFVFQHMVDPIGTLQQTISLLKPASGLLLTDSFDFNFLNYRGQEVFPYDKAEKNGPKLLTLLAHSVNNKIEFLMCPNLEQPKQNHFAIKKHEELDDLSIAYQKAHIKLDDGTIINPEDRELTYTSGRVYDTESMTSIKLVNSYKVYIPMLFVYNENSCGASNSTYIGSSEIHKFLHQEDSMLYAINLSGEQLSQTSYYGLNQCNLDISVYEYTN